MTIQNKMHMHSIPWCFEDIHSRRQNHHFRNNIGNNEQCNSTSPPTSFNIIYVLSLCLSLLFRLNPVGQETLSGGLVDVGQPLSGEIGLMGLPEKVKSLLYLLRLMKDVDDGPGGF